MLWSDCGAPRRLLGHTWLAWQIASGAVLAEASWPLFLLLQFRQSDMTDRWGTLLWCAAVPPLLPHAKLVMQPFSCEECGAPGRVRIWSGL